jgi:hypothetical protein
VELLIEGVDNNICWKTWDGIKWWPESARAKEWGMTNIKTFSKPVVALTRENKRQAYHRCWGNAVYNPIWDGESLSNLVPLGGTVTKCPFIEPNPLIEHPQLFVRDSYRTSHALKES